MTFISLCTSSPCGKAATRTTSQLVKIPSRFRVQKEGNRKETVASRPDNLTARIIGHVPRQLPFRLPRINQYTLTSFKSKTLRELCSTCTLIFARSKINFTVSTSRLKVSRANNFCIHIAGDVHVRLGNNYYQDCAFLRSLYYTCPHLLHNAFSSCIINVCRRNEGF